MKLQTQISLQPERNQIDYASKVLLLGSCFVENIGRKLEYYKFQNCCNPFGIVFHPLAIEKLVTRAINATEFVDDDLFFQNERWHCFEVHSEISHSEKDTFLNNLNEALKLLKAQILAASHIVFTYGTSHVYRHIETDTVVANCHKIPQKKFLKELLSPEDIAGSLDNTITLIRDINHDVNFITTVSPVRHIKDGFVENTLSKAHLISGIHTIVDPRQKVHYFPSFEIMMDELRDYRFYGEDMIHPGNVAINIIWERFKLVWISSETESLQKEIGVIQSGLQHKPFNEQSEAHQAFLKDLQKKIENIQNMVPRIKFR
tara:strand:+ start:100207 stop:101157 length:951 start_codon:yes stop_codon:yes gene_type:complete